MELEFDKEIDAILRKARSGKGVAGTAAASPHLDADTIAAFVENALPPRSKMLYMEHIADCDRCRRVLSQTVLLNSGHGVETAEAETQPDMTPAAIIPWYKRLFATPALAAAMGAVILAFSGILGYVVLQERSRPNAEISRATEPGPVQGGPFYGGEADYPTANKPSSAVAANSAAMPPISSAANTAANTAISANRADASSLSAANTRTDSEPKPETFSDERRTAAAAPPPAPTGGVPATASGDAKSDDGNLKAKEEDAIIASKSADDRMVRDMPPAAKKSGPVRSGPSNAQVQMQTQNVITENSLRTVNGKSFDRRGGVWYDLAYKGQSAKKVSRGSSEYKDLDGGLRNIAETLDGTVVVMWKEKAYRIQ